MQRRFPELIVMLAVASLLGACGSAVPLDPASTSAMSRDTAKAPLACFDRCDVSAWTPLPAATPVSPAVQLARDTYLGEDATDPNQVKLWWTGVSSFIAAAGGHLFLFDAWEIVGPHEDYLPIGREELAAIQPELILIGHGHFDHAADAGYVAARSGAVVVGSEVICDQVKEDAAASLAGGADNFACLIVGVDDNTPQPGTVQSIKLWEDMAEVQILQHIHSAATPEFQDPGTPYAHIPDLLTYIEHVNTNPQEILQFLPTLADQPGGAWAYHLRVGDFSLLWHDTVGPINSGNPYAQEVQSALNDFPDCVDVQLVPIVGFNQPMNGLRDPRLYVEHAHPRLILPTHHDSWEPVVGGGARSYEGAWRSEVATLEHPPLQDYLRDPEDYLLMRSYRIDDPIWKIPMPGSSCAEQTD